jgi:hypothetical protein
MVAWPIMGWACWHAECPTEGLGTPALSWVRARTPSPTCSGLGAHPKPNMFGSRQRAWTHFSSLMVYNLTLTRDFFETPRWSYINKKLPFISISYRSPDLPDITSYYHSYWSPWLTRHYLLLVTCPWSLYIKSPDLTKKEWIKLLEHFLSMRLSNYITYHWRITCVLMNYMTA